MRVLFFSSKPYDTLFFTKENKDYGFDLQFTEIQLNQQTVKSIDQVEAVCVFVNDQVNASVIEQLAKKGVKLIALRCAGFNNVDLEAAKKHGLKVCRVPAYSPEAVAEHTMAMVLTLNRKTHKAYNRVREQNFALNGLLGFNLNGKTVGIVGTGKIGKAFAKIADGFGCHIIASDPFPDENFAKENKLTYVSLEQLWKTSDVISLHCPLTPESHYMVNEESIASMKKGVALINTSRGGLINTQAVINALKRHEIAYLGIDVYEQEEKLFFNDLSMEIIEDDTIQRLMSFPNVLVTAHQAFFTEEALTQIAQITLNSIDELVNSKQLTNDSVIL